MNSIEHRHQCALFRWAELQAGQHPELRLMFAVPNGGHRAKAVANKLKAEGVRAGVPDVCLPVARHGAHALWIEMKTERGTLRPHQRKWIEALNAQQHRAVVCYGVDEAITAVSGYLGIGT